MASATAPGQKASSVAGWGCGPIFEVGLDRSSEKGTGAVQKRTPYHSRPWMCLRLRIASQCHGIRPFLEDIAMTSAFIVLALGALGHGHHAQASGQYIEAPSKVAPAPQAPSKCLPP